MKNVMLLALGLGFVFTSSAIAASNSDICVAQKISNVGYSSVMYYDLKCIRNQSQFQFTSPKIVTSFLLPIPYQWTKVATKKLLLTMSEKQYNQVATIPEVPSSIINYRSAFTDSLIIFNKVKTNANYCAASRTNPQQSGIEHNKYIYNFTISCSKDNKIEHFNGITMNEFGKYMSSIGVRFLMTYNDNGGYPEDRIFIYEEQNQ